MVTDKFKKALYILAEKLEGIDWVVASSASIALQGGDINPQDIDIWTDEEGAKKADELLKEFVVNPVEYSEKDNFKAFLGKFKIKGVEVEILGDFELFSGEDWISFQFVLDHHEVVDLDGVNIPVTYLEDQLEAYKVASREKDFEKIDVIQAMNSSLLDDLDKESEE